MSDRKIEIPGVWSQADTDDAVMAIESTPSYIRGIASLSKALDAIEAVASVVEAAMKVEEWSSNDGVSLTEYMTAWDGLIKAARELH
jgi:hypothetical protein